MRKLDISSLPAPVPRPADCVVHKGTAIICPCDLCRKEWGELWQSLKDKENE